MIESLHHTLQVQWVGLPEDRPRAIAGFSHGRSRHSHQSLVILSHLGELRPCRAQYALGTRGSCENLPRGAAVSLVECRRFKPCKAKLSKGVCRDRWQG